jgi:hypothetical protein
MPPHLRRFSSADWLDETPSEPPADFVLHWDHQMGTKGTLEEEWARQRYMLARRLWQAGRHDWRQNEADR